MRGVGAGTRIFELLARQPHIPPHTGVEVSPIRRGSVKFEGVTFEYPSRKGVEILKDFDLEIGVGESVVIVYVFLRISELLAVILTFYFLELAGRAVAANPQFIPSCCGTTIP